MIRFLQWLVALEWPARTLDPWFGSFNPFLPEHRRDPHATWRYLQWREPVFFSRVLRVWVCTRYDDVVRILRDPRFGADRSQITLMKILRPFLRRDPEFAQFVDRVLLNLDPPDHTRLRGLVSKAFTPRRIDSLRPRLQTIVDDLLDQIAKRGEMELVRDLAQPLPVIAIAEMLGVPAEDRDRFKVWSAALVQILDPFQGSGGIAPARQANRELNAYFRPLLDKRRSDPQDDLLSAMITVEERGERLSETDLLALANLLLVAGHETTTNLIGNAVITLLRHPDERKRLQQHPGLITSAVDEFLRYEGPVQMTERVAREDCEIGGKRIRKGQLVWPVLAAANRDPAHFPDPDRLDLGRVGNHHVSFGMGAHFCIGSQLAKLEAEIAIGSLLERFPDLVGDADPPAWKRSMVLRGPESLPLRF